MLDGGGRPGGGVLFGIAGHLIGSRVSELFHPGSSLSRSAPLPPLGVLASGSQTAKFIASCLLGQMKMEVEVPLRVGCVVQTFVELWVLLLV